ncbi:MAG: WYL domain-containing protein, partial [Gemmatimonadaceae bacterium]
MNTPKLQRWIDLLAALLGHHQPVTFTELTKFVPAYLADGSVNSGDASDTVKRMFERDKLELREQGVPLESIGEDGSEESAYTIRARDFYLPYLGIVSARGFDLPPMVDRYGYRSLVKLAFEPDELEAIAAASRRIMQIGDSRLSEIAASAMRKLAFDLPMGATDGGSEAILNKPAASDDSRALALLDNALVRRKNVQFSYRSMAAHEATDRHAEPYGLFFIGSHWYVVARDVQKDALRN